MPAIVLAAGASRRLGTPKQLASFHGETLLARTLRVVRDAGADPIFVVLGANAEEIASAVDLSATQTVLNQQWQSGISSSIRAGLRALLQNDPSTQAAMLLVCDQPSLTGTYLKSLIAAYASSEPDSIAASHYAGIAGIPAIFPASQFATLQSLTGDTGARQLLRAPECTMIAIPFEGGDLDIDTPEDLRRLE